MTETRPKNSLQQSQRLGQAIWLDNIRRGLLKSGELQQLIDTGITGLTANPTILEKAIVGSTDYDEALAGVADKGKTPLEIYETLAIEDIRGAADLFRPIYDRTHTADGYVSLEVSPLIAYDTEKTVQEARRLFKTLARPNVMVKVPATPQGISAIRLLTGEGINVNVTLIFSLGVYAQVKEAYVAGLEDLLKQGGNPSGVASVASFFLSRIDTLVDAMLEERIKVGRTELKALLGQAAIASAKVAYAEFQKTFSSPRFAALKEKGARPQRLLWASTGTKNPAYSDVMYVEPLIGAETVNTMPPVTIHAFLDHGKAALTIGQGTREASQALEGLKSAGISLKDVTDKLLADGVKAFSDSFDKLLAGIEAKAAGLGAWKPVTPGTDLGGYESDVRAALEKLGREDVTRRIWRKDHTVWSNSPKEITDRLGWLNVTDMMRAQVPAMEAFVREVRDAGIRHVVLLGMGGSSLGAEVLRQVFGSAPGFPEMTVLDSTLPAAILAVTETVDPRRTLFLVSSKSGTTTEPLLLYRYFRGLVEKATGAGSVGLHFVAITDPGTPLVGMAEKEGFRRVFLNPADIGGRYSVLSYFGLVPGALIGVDIKLLVDRADAMREGCASSLPQAHNYGSWLGACIGALALKGRDKMTLVTSLSLASFGLWVEQIIAESTGKEGKGIVPVAGEPLLSGADYWSDRLFVYLRLRDEDNATLDKAIHEVRQAGHPVIVLDLRDRYDLGAEFFRWEFATAVAGAVLGVNPFDQPNVQQAKEATERVLKDVCVTGRPTQMTSDGSLHDLLAGARPGDYLAIMAYVRQTPETDRVFSDLRRTVAERYHIPTMVCYGPRFLHSTGQLHKGGPHTGLFLQITAGHDPDVTIPGEPFTFGVVADAQALGDFQALRAAGRRVASVRLPWALIRELIALL